MSRMTSIAGAVNRAAGGGVRATIDTSELDVLAGLLAHAADEAEGETSQLLDKEVPKTFEEARSTVAGYPKATGATAASMGHDTEGHTRRIWAGTKQGALLEYGTPTTGPPRPWLTGPAQRASRRILEEMAEIGAIF